MNIKDRIHIYPQIEKTGGVTLFHVYKNIYGAKHVYYFDTQTNTFIRHDEFYRLVGSSIWKSVSVKYGQKNWFTHLIKIRHFLESCTTKHYHLNEIPTSARLLQGHFSMGWIIKRYPNALKSIIIRDPLDRMISHYLHWKRTRGLARFRIKIPYDESISFNDFAFLDVYRDFQMQFLSGFSLTDFDLVGVTDRLNEYIIKLGNFFNKQQDNIPEIHNSSRKEDLAGLKKQMNNAFKAKFYRFHNLDNALYKEANALFDKL